MSRLKSKLIKKIVTITTVAVAACNDANLPSAPQLEPSAGLVGESVRAARRAARMQGDVVVTEVIGARGGKLKAAGVSLDIPAGAVRQPTAITMTVSGGDYYQVHFQPHGLQFAKPASLSFQLQNALRSPFVVYFDAMSADGEVTPLETFEVTRRGSSVITQIGHFSGYCVAYD